MQLRYSFASEVHSISERVHPLPYCCCPSRQTPPALTHQYYGSYATLVVDIHHSIVEQQFWHCLHRFIFIDFSYALFLFNFFSQVYINMFTLILLLNKYNIVNNQSVTINAKPFLGTSNILQRNTSRKIIFVTG